MPLTTRCWLATQVELQGQYTNRQLQDFARYHASTPWWRVIVTLVITPLPCVLCVILVDTLRLEPPTSSSLESPMFWTRAFLFTIAMTLSTLEHFRQHVLDLNFSLPLMLSLTLIVSTTTVGAGIVMSILIGYPMPFTIVIVTFPWFLILTTGIAATKWQQLATNKRLIVSALRYLLVCMCQIVITVFYPLYNHAFKRMTPIPQTLFVLVLPLFKIAAKNWIARALDSADVGKPEAVVFNVELFHALYVAFCMQNTTSTGTIAVIMGIDFVQSVVSFSDIENIAKNIRVDIAKEDQATDFLAGGNDMRRIRLADHLLAFIVDEVGTLQPPPMPQQSKGPRLASVSPLPLPKGSLKRQSSTGLQNLKRAEHSGLMDHMQHLLFVTEFVVLVEFTEVVMPIIYSTFAASCQCLRDILTSIVRESSLGLGKCSHDVSARRAAASTDEFDVEMTDQGEKVERKSAEQPEALEENATPAAVAPIEDKWRFHDGKFKNRREQWLYYCAYFPHCGQDKMRGVVLFLHGIGEYARRFSHVFDVLCSHGFGVIAYDMISHGRSDSDEEGERAHALDFQHFVDDTNVFVSLAKQYIFPHMTVIAPPPPLIFMGMSYGTLVGLHTILSEQHAFDAIVLAAPALSVEWTPVLKFLRNYMTPVAKLLPRIRITPGVNYSYLSRNPEFVENFLADPLITTAKLTARMATETLAAMESIQHDPRVGDPTSSLCSKPLLIVQGTDDKITSVALAEEFFARVGTSDKQFKKFDGLYHCIFNEPEHDAVTDHICRWLCDRFPL